MLPKLESSFSQLYLILPSSLHASHLRARAMDSEADSGESEGLRLIIGMRVGGASVAGGSLNSLVVLKQW